MGSYILNNNKEKRTKIYSYEEKVIGNTIVSIISFLK